jgi:signal transduction histidine kinase
VRGFPVELRQVFFNLIGNAIQAMPEGGRLRIGVAERWNERMKRSDLWISVCDTGSGVMPEHAQHVFEPFFSTKSNKGTGLGLWISKGIAQKYDGTIRFRSLPYRGANMTAFLVVLPGRDAASKLKAAANYSAADETRGTLGRT